MTRAIMFADEQQGLLTKSAVGIFHVVNRANARETIFGHNDDYAAFANVLILDAIGNRTTWGYDAASQQRFRIDGRGNRTTYVHDDAVRLTGRRYPDGSRVTFAFDALGARTGDNQR